MSYDLESALSAIDAHSADPMDRAKARGLMRGYDARWGGIYWDVVSAETEFHLPIINPETGRPSRTFTHAGKIDAKILIEGRKFNVEHKTTGQDITDPNSSYWRTLAIDSQVSHYALTQWQGGDKVDGTIYDVIRKPTIRLKQSETHEEFEERLAADALARPEFYYGRKMVPRMDSELLEYAKELWDQAQAIGEAMTKNRHFRNSGACMNYGRACEYLGICSGHDTPDSDKWKQRETVHEELETEFEKRGVGVLSHSRIRTFMTCQRKHWYRYVVGIERADDETAEALRFGKLFHHALEAWTNPKQEVAVNDNTSSNDTPASAVGDVASIAG